MKRYSFSPQEKEKIARVAQKHKLKLVIAFGSAVTGLRHERSDLDIAVLTTKPDASLNTLGAIILEIQEIFPDVEVDLAVINHADPLFLKKIMETAETLYGRPEALSEMKIYAYKRYIDHKKYLAMEKNFAVEYAKRLRTAG